MIPEPTHLKFADLEDDFPENLVVVAQRFFRWLCERKEERLSLRRFDDRELKFEIDGHAQETQLIASKSGNSEWFQFSRFCEDENVDQEEFKESREALGELLWRALLQFHLAYHDLLSGESNPKFKYEMFKDVWAQTRSMDTSLNESDPLEERREPGRPGIDDGWMKKRLIEFEEAEGLPFLEGPWRTGIAQILLDDYMENYRPRPKKTFKVATVRDRMRGAFDALEDRDKNR